MIVVVEGISFEVDYKITPACRGSRDSYGVPLEPDEPAEIEIQSIELLPESYKEDFSTC